MRLMRMLWLITTASSWQRGPAFPGFECLVFREAEAKRDAAIDGSGQWLRPHWFEHGEDVGNPSSAHTKRFRVNAPSVIIDPTFAVRVSEVTVHGDMDCFQVETPTATYVYGKRGAGFASIIDKDGRDWVSYRPGDKARGEYRGLPKCGQPTKFFHCGYGYGQYKTDNPFSSRVTVRRAEPRPHRVRDARRQVRLHVGLLPGPRDVDALCGSTCRRSGSSTKGHRGASSTPRRLRHPPRRPKTTLDQPWSQVVPWVCFGAAETPVGLRLVNHQDPEPGEVDSYVSWPFEETDDGSFQDMTVFGFGRKGLQGAGRARPRSEAPARPLQHRVHRSGRPRHGQGGLRQAPTQDLRELKVASLDPTRDDEGSPSHEILPKEQRRTGLRRGCADGWRSSHLASRERSRNPPRCRRTTRRRWLRGLSLFKERVRPLLIAQCLRLSWRQGEEGGL